MASQIQQVGLLGADGKLGPHVLHALIAQGFRVTVLKRASSKSKDDYTAGVRVAKVPDDFDVNAVSKAVEGLHAVVVTIKGSNTDLQAKLAEACVKAKVKRFIPADFGSCDSQSKWAQELVPLFKRKTELREHLIQLSNNNDDFTWTSLVCGHFFDWSPEFLHFWVREQKVDIFDDGETKWSASTLSRIGEATARILSNPEVTKNQVVYVQSFLVSQNDLVKSLEQATSSKWQVTKLDSKQYEQDEKAKAEDGDLEAVENLVWLLGTLEADWTGKDNFAMRTLSLENEDLDTEVQRVVKQHQ